MYVTVVDLIYCFLQNDKILKQSKLKAFIDNKINVTQKLKVSALRQ